MHYAAIVKDFSTCRRLIDVGSQIVRDAYDHRDSGEVLAAEARLARRGSDSTLPG